MMSDPVYDLVICNGFIVTASEVVPPPNYIGVRGETIQVISRTPLVGERTIDAQGGFITPGGIDSHVHIHQDDSPTIDKFDSASRSAIAGGTTTIIPFAVQKKDAQTILPAISEYHNRARGKCYCDYGFHVIITNPTKTILEHDLVEIVKNEGITSVKVYTTYDIYKVDDFQLLNILVQNRKLGITTMIHAENSDMVRFLCDKLESKGLYDPSYHSISRPSLCEDEATYRVISLAKLIDVPILIVHMAAKDALTTVRKAQSKLIPIYAETCPQYMFLTSEKMKNQDHPLEGGKFLCSPSLRTHASELDEIWRALRNGTVTTFSSDHCPVKFNHPQGKKLGLVDGIPHFTQIPNGMSGIETRVPLLFCNGLETGRISPQKFVEVTASNPAKLYGLSARKGSISIGMDADITVWFPKGKLPPFVLTNNILHHDTDYTPYEGMIFTNWPRFTILRGKIRWARDQGGILGMPGDGKYLKRGHSALNGSISNINPIFE